MRKIRLFNQDIPLPLALLAVIEFLLLMGSVYFAVHVRFFMLEPEPSMSPQDVQALLGPLLLRASCYAVVVFLSMLSLGLYSSRYMLLGQPGIHLRLMVSHFLGFIGFIFLMYLLPDLFLGRGVLGIAILISLFLITAMRGIFFSLMKSNQLQRRVLVYGTGSRAHYVDQMKHKLHELGSTIVGYIAVADEPVSVDRRFVVELKSPLKDFARLQLVDEIVVAIDERRGQLPIDGLLDCRLAGIDVVDLPAFFESRISNVRLDLLTPSWLIFNSGFENSGFSDAVKRVFDLLASVGLLLIAWPIMLFTILSIKLEDGWQSSVIYKQVRVGKGGMLFEIYKFRSMRNDAETGQSPRWAVEHDTRVTRVGQVIRKFRIDELPQLWNVIRGEMSFVGPRPERPEFVASLGQKIPYYNERHRVKPGLTGWAQLNYPYGASDKDSLEKLQYDLFYTKNRNLMLDLLILLQTVEVVLFGKGAR